ncbi:hypothetical protein H2200_012976 [Cladophialophora chaetospira]|uniref:Nucleoside-diphosphate-sugar epimerase n=1 Tax=Cladophialophora chaetospira TaxID=386627 RepID=A0AA39CBM8_9EURO|nr:hypothetical protein H2200_012976 [Cladophialophora chaetospira]
MVHLILTGVTGLVGGSVLSHILSLPPTSKPVIDKVSILTRSTSIPWLSATPPAGTPNANKHTQIEVIEHKDFNTYPPELLKKLEGADACIWSLGISQNAVTKDEYVKITKEYSVEAAKAFSSLRASNSTSDDPDAKKFKFIYVSGEGANLHPGMFTPLFGRVKGETERALLEVSKTTKYSPLLSVYSVRPAAVDGTNQPWIWKEVLNTKRTAFQRFYLPTLLYPIRWGWTGHAFHSPTEELGRVLVEMAVSEHREPFEVGDGVDAESEGRTLGNKRLRMLEKGQGWWK